MLLNHCTEFEVLKGILRSRCLRVGDLPDLPELAKLGVRGVWLSTASYSDQFFGPYRLSFAAADLLPKEFLILKEDTPNCILLSSHSPNLPDLAKVIGARHVTSSDSTSPLRYIAGNWTHSRKVDVVYDFPIPISKAVAISAANSFRDRDGNALSGLNQMTPWSTGRLAALLLTTKITDLDSVARKDAQLLANALFYVLGFNFERTAKEIQSHLPPSSVDTSTLVEFAAESLANNNHDDAKLAAAMAGSAEALAELVANALKKRFGCLNISTAEMLKQ